MDGVEVNMGTGKRPVVDWSSESSHLILNPKLKSQMVAGLDLSRLPQLPGHIWLASSGSGSSSGSVSASGSGSHSEEEISLTLYALSRPAFFASGESVNQHLKVDSQDIWLNVLPHFHVGGLSIGARAYLKKNKIFDVSDQKWSAEGFHCWCAASQATLTSLVPTQVFDLVQLGRSAPVGLRAIVVGGDRLSEDLYFRARQLGFRVLPSYGMTECCSQIATAPLGSLSVTEGPIAYPDLELLPHIEVRTDEIGRLLIRSPSLFTMRVFWSTRDAKIISAEEIHSGDWYRTSDEVEILSSSGRGASTFLRVLGREQDQVKISGERIHLSTLVPIFERICGQNDFYLSSQPDPRRGAEVVIVLLEKNFHHAEEWIRTFNQQVLPVAKIRAAYFISEIPRTEMGKVKRKSLEKILRSSRR